MSGHGSESLQSDYGSKTAHYYRGVYVGITGVADACDSSSSSGASTSEDFGGRVYAPQCGQGEPRRRR
jgi:hypothetical protein